MHITPPGTRRFQPQRSIVVAAILAVAVLGVGKAAYAAYGKYISQKGRTAKISEVLAATRAHEDSLRSENEWLNTGRAEEAIVRERYMVTRPGEKVIVITEGE